MEDLLTWYRKQLDDDEAAARMWPEGCRTWQTVGNRCVTYKNGASETISAIDVSGKPALWDERIQVMNAYGKLDTHIVRHDPVHVLADIAAKRALIDTALAYEAKIDGEWGCCHDADQIAAGECADTPPDKIPALRLLASGYADRPGYREEWRP